MKVKRIKAPYVLAALVLAMTGCEYLGPQIHTKLPLPEVNPAQEEELQVQPELERKTTMVELFPDGEPSISQVPSGSPADMGGGRKNGKGEYSLNFDDADLGEVAKVILSDILGKNYTISPQVTGKVTLQTTSPLTKEELMPTLDMLLSVNNAALVNQGGMYLIKPANEAVYGSPVRAMPNGYQTRVIPIRNVSAGDVAEVLKPLLPEKSLLQADTSRNILLVAGSGAELGRVMELVRIFDVDMLRGRSFGLFTPAHVDASKVIEELDEIFNGSGKKGKEGGESFFKFIEIDRMNAVLAITHKASYLQDIETWVRRLDRTNAEAGGGVHVYKAQNVSAAELADTLNDIFGTGGGGRSKSASIASGRRAASASNRGGGSGIGSSSFGSSGIGSSSRSGGSSGIGTSMGMGANISGIGADRKAASGGGTDPSSGNSSSGAGNTSVAGSMGGQIFESNVKIVADDSNNALIIVANSEDYAKILPVIKQLDVLPLQVIIDATIAEVTLDDDLKYGIQWFFSHNNGGTNVIRGGDASQGGFDFGKLASDAGKAFASGGFTYAFSSNSKDINAILRASALKDKVNVISSPSLMVLNNQEAQIRVGDSVPILTGTSTSLVSTGVTSNQIQMVDTGVQLLVKPRVNAGGLVLMEIQESVDDAKPTSGLGGTGTSDINSPTINKRQIDTSVAVQSGETIVLGGLIQNTDTHNRDGVPFLHEIPLIGPIFGFTERRNKKTELVVLLTPRVMKSRQDAQDMTEEFKRKLTGIYEERTSVDTSMPADATVQ